MKQVYRLISKVLHSEANILLTGETGTGKELVARAIHEYGHRRTQPFVVACLTGCWKVSCLVIKKGHLQGPIAIIRGCLMLLITASCFWMKSVICR